MRVFGLGVVNRILRASPNHSAVDRSSETHLAGRDLSFNTDSFALDKRGLGRARGHQSQGLNINQKDGESAANLFNPALCSRNPLAFAEVPASVVCGCRQLTSQPVARTLDAPSVSAVVVLNHGALVFSWWIKIRFSFHLTIIYWFCFSFVLFYQEMKEVLNLLSKSSNATV